MVHFHSITTNYKEVNFVQLTTMFLVLTECFLTLVIIKYPKEIINLLTNKTKCSQTDKAELLDY